MYDYGGHDCDAPLGVVVHQENGNPIRLPIVDDGLQLYERKVGPTSITRRAEATIPIEGLGEDNWLTFVSAFSPPEDTPVPRDRLSQSDDGVSDSFTTESPPSRVQTADVIGQPIDSDGNPVGEPEVHFRGYIGAIGSQEGANRAQIRLHDPMKFLGTVSAKNTFKQASVRDILQYIVTTFEDNQPVFDTIRLDTEGLSARPLVDQLLSSFDLGDALRQALADETIADQFTFSPNRDTLADVLSLVTTVTNNRVWFQPDGQNGLVLTAVADSTVRYDLTPTSDQFPRVIKNNALFEMRPLNAVKLNGAIGDRISVGPLTAKSPFGDQYPEAVATYPPLVERYGGQLTKTADSNIGDAEQLEVAAESQLKDALDGVSGGSMVTTLAPICRPYDTVQATPACSGVTADVEDLQYEVQEATHSLVPSDSNLPRTELAVSISINPSLIESSSTIKDTATGGTPTDDDPLDSYQFGPGSP